MDQKSGGSGFQQVVRLSSKAVTLLDKLEPRPK